MALLTNWCGIESLLREILEIYIFYPRMSSIPPRFEVLYEVVSK